MEKILRSGAVWAALLVVVNLVVKAAWPNVSLELLAAVNALALAILGAVGIVVQPKIEAHYVAKAKWQLFDGK